MIPTGLKPTDEIIITTNKTLRQIISAVCKRRVEKHGNMSRAAASLGIDMRTLSKYVKKGE